MGSSHDSILTDAKIFKIKNFKGPPPKKINQTSSFSREMERDGKSLPSFHHYNKKKLEELRVTDFS